MQWWEAILLGVVEGLTEYLPVSSTGHLLLTERALGMTQTDASDAFAICIQAGAILAVLGLYFGRVRQMTLGVLGKDKAGLRLVTCVVVGFIPAMVIGLTLNKTIKAHLFGLWPTVGAWIVGGVAILGVSFWRSRQRKSNIGSGLDQLTWKLALVVGMCQCLAMWPGTSRSLVTIVGGVMVGLSLPAAVEFSFLLGLLTLSAATAYDALKHGQEMIQSYGIGMIALGLVSAWISATIAVKWMVGYLNRHGMQLFGWYRIVLGLAVAGLILSGFLMAE